MTRLTPCSVATPTAIVDRFLKAGRYLRNWSEKTIETYQQSLRDLPDAPLTKPILDQWVIGLRQRGLTPGGINVRIRSVNSFLSWLKEEGEIDQPIRLKLLKVPLLSPICSPLPMCVP